MVSEIRATQKPAYFCNF